jgi:Zn-dependent protease
MRDDPPIEPGPWERAQARAAAQAAGRVGGQAASAVARPGSGDPSLIGNLVATALLAAFLVWRIGPLPALAAMVGLFVHEYGHVAAMNWLGCGPAKIRIVPFLGGAAIPAREPKSEFHGVIIALAGPVLGLLAISPFFLAYAATGEAGWLRGTLVIGFINLVNLAPAPPLDGSKALGPVLARIHPALEKVALIAIGALVVIWLVQQHNWIIAAFIGVSLIGALQRGPMRAPSRPLTGLEMGLSFAAYLGSAALCLLTMYVALDGLGLSPTPASLLKMFGFG